jgi:hypothetical protein
MQPDRFLTIVGLAISVIAGSAALGGHMAYAKRRSPMEGLLLGLLLGPIGVLIEWRTPFAHRPLVDENSWNSIRSMMDYQLTGREFKQRDNRAEKRRKDREKKPRTA